MEKFSKKQKDSVKKEDEILAVNGQWALLVEQTSRENEENSQSFENLSFSVQQDDSDLQEYITLSKEPTDLMTADIYNHYTLLLSFLSEWLFSSEVELLVDWALRQHCIHNVVNATDVFLQLDQKGIVNASNLGPLCSFFWSINRIDLVYIIDEYLLGDYKLLRQALASKKHDICQSREPQSSSRFSTLHDSTTSTSLPSIHHSNICERNVSSSLLTGRNQILDKSCDTSQNSNPTQSLRATTESLPTYLKNSNPPSANDNQNASKQMASTCSNSSIAVVGVPVTSKFLIL